MKNCINEIYNLPMSAQLKAHIMNDLGFSDMDKSILESLFTHSGDSNFHYDNTHIPKEKFERHLRNINNVVFAELVRLSNGYLSDR